MTAAKITEHIAKHEDAVRRICLFAALVVFAVGVVLFFLGNVFENLPIPERIIPKSLLSTITPPFAIILVYELFVLTLATAGSYVTFVIKQFEVISLIVLRDLFKRLDELSMSFNANLLTEVGIIAGGAVVLYFLIEILQRIERHFISGSLKEEIPGKVKQRQQRFKDVLELLLMAFFAAVAVYEAAGWLLGIPGTGFNTTFVNIIFSGVIVYSICLLLLVLSTTGSYEILFEYSALVLTAILALIAFDAPVYIRIPMLIATLIFIIIVLTLHGFARGKSMTLLLKHLDAK